MQALRLIFLKVYKANDSDPKLNPLYGAHALTGRSQKFTCLAKLYTLRVFVGAF